MWQSQRVLFVEYAAGEGEPHTLMAQVSEVGGTIAEKLAVLQADAAQHFARLPDDLGEPPMPLVEVPVEEVLADLAGVLRHTDMLWPRHDDEDFVEVRALAWERCRSYLPEWPEFESLPAARRQELIDEFVAELDGLNETVARSLADLFLDYGDGYIPAGALAWSPGWVAVFLTDWLPRKAVLDAEQRVALPETLRRWLRFVLVRRGVEAGWIDPVVAAVEECLPDFVEAFDDEASWGPAKQIAAALAARGVDLTDRAAVEQAVSAYNAERLARGLIES